MAENDFIDSVFEKVLTPVLALIKLIIGLLFKNRLIAFIFYLIFVNIIAVILMKRDKTYAEKGERRIRESTLFIVALVGGSIGMYFSMFKFKHKTLHPQFSIGVPAILCMQCAFLSYLAVTNIFSV